MPSGRLRDTRSDAPASDRTDAARATERWIAWVRLGAVGFALLQVFVLGDPTPAGYRAVEWAATACLGAGAVVFLLLARRRLSAPSVARVGAAALAFDTAIVSAYVVSDAWQPGSPVRQLLLIPVIEAAVRYGVRGGVALPLALAPVGAAFEWLRSREVTPHRFAVDDVTFTIGVQLIAGLIVGSLVVRLRAQTELAEARAAEAERFRDELRRRTDLLEAANRCARALGSSLEPERAFAAFLDEVRELVPFDRIAIALTENEQLRIVAVAGAGQETTFPPGTVLPLSGSAVQRVLDEDRPVYSEDMRATRLDYEQPLLALGLRARVVVPLSSGAEPIGALAVSRAEPASFSPGEVELLSLLGRVAATAVRNIRAYEAERETVSELRRLSAMRADFVSLVSHEMRSPMAAVVGAARTLLQRWRELTPEQRASFLALIADETSRLSTLVEDVLDTSRIESGSFAYTFSEVDVGEVVREAVATAQLAQGEVPLHAEVTPGLPVVRADRVRLRQVLDNLIDNAVKYSSPGEPVRVAAFADNGRIHVEVRDSGPGIPPESQRVIFEKFGRAPGDGTKPGTGLGLFIARSIAQAHGGSLDVRSAPGRGTTFALALPVEN